MVIGRGALVLCMLASAMAVSSPEIAAGKSTKASATTVAANQQQQQQQQKATQLRSQQDAHLNSINAYATNYQAAAAAAANQQQSNPSTFKPTHSYSAQVYSSQPATATTKLISVPTNVDIENNFQPMPAVQAVGQLTQSSPPSPSQPVIMQYLPQTQMHDGIQYLQLIPTRPLMVPISPYLSALSNQQTQTSAAAAATAAYHPQPHHHHHQILSPSNVVDYAARPAVLSPIHAPQPLSPLHSIAAAADAPYGLQTYANSLQNYRAYRINREVRDKNLPPNFTLNMYEYMPTPNDAPQHYIIRPRP